MRTNVYHATGTRDNGTERSASTIGAHPGPFSTGDCRGIERTRAAEKLGSAESALDGAQE
ncbi:hypothetical protein ACNS7O_08445 [Haloferacaceae archaeon DSL9]